MKHIFLRHSIISIGYGFDKKTILFPKKRIGFIKYMFCLFFILFSSSYLFSQNLIHTLEAESGELTLPAKKKQVNGYSGGAYVGDNDAGSAIVFRDVNVGEEGTYEFRTYYTSMHIRAIAIKSGNYPKVISTCPETTPDWNAPPVAVMVTYVYLNKGNNTLTITPVGEGAPNMDKFEIWATTVSMPKPDPVRSAFSYDLTDDAVITSTGVADNLALLNDNDETTAYSTSHSPVEIKIECDQPYLLTGYFLSAGPESSQNVKNWKMEYSIDGRTYSNLSPTQTDATDNGAFFYVSRTPHADRNKAARYYKLTAQGGQIGEVQLFGIPYIANSDNKNFPADVTQGLSIQTKVLGDPLGAYQFGSFDERCYNLFDRDMSKKYYWGSGMTFNVEVELATPVRLDYYTLTSCQDYPERDPKAWVVEGFDKDWEVVSEVSGFDFPTRYATMKFNTNNGKSYKGYRLRTLENHGAGAFQLLKWQLFGEKDGTAIVDIDESGTMIFTSEQGIIIKSDAQGEYHIINLSGQLISAGEIDIAEQRVPLAPGVYIVKITNGKTISTGKVLVK